MSILDAELSAQLAKLGMFVTSSTISRRDASEVVDIHLDIVMPMKKFKEWNINGTVTGRHNCSAPEEDLTDLRERIGKFVLR